MLANKLRIYDEANADNGVGGGYSKLEKYDTSEDYFAHKITNYGYGKDAVKLLHITRNGPVHSVKEFEVSTRLKLYTKKDYIYGNENKNKNNYHCVFVHI